MASGKVSPSWSLGTSTTGYITRERVGVVDRVEGQIGWRWDLPWGWWLAFWLLTESWRRELGLCLVPLPFFSGTVPWSAFQPP